jgi:methionyl-tRNA formyltransferase
MSAIEMMDPKMDAGLLINQSKSKIKSVDDAIKVNIMTLNRLNLID